MRICRLANLLASAAGLIALVGLDLLMVHLLSPEKDLVPNAVLSIAFTVPIAVGAWSGALWNQDKSIVAEFDTWVAWVALFFVGSVISLLFVLIDCGMALPLPSNGYVCDGTPGLSLILTVGAISMTLITLPSALRAWLLSVLVAKSIAEPPRDA